MLLAGVNIDTTRLQLIQIHTRVGVLIEFNLVEELYGLYRRGYTRVLNLKKGTRRPPERNPNNKHYPFEKLGYVPNMDGMY